MAELVLFIGNQQRENGYKDGDVCDCFNTRRVLCTHAEHICHVKHAGFNRDGLRPAGSLTERFKERAYQYKFERVSRTQIKRILLADGSEEIFGPEAIDVEEFIARRVAHNLHAIFGSSGREYWFGGRRDVPKPVVDDIWTQIETHSANRKSDHGDWPLSQNELRLFLAVPTADFTDEQQESYRSPVYNKDDDSDRTRVMLKRRAHTVLWRDLPGLSGVTAGNVERRDVVVAKPRNRTHPLNLILRKP